MASSSSFTEAHHRIPMNPKPLSSDLSPSSAAPPPKKKRSQPGMPRPDAEVIALSPKTLQATNRFICEVCNKGFQREQNLQLHRRGHNLPWKLRQKSTSEVKRKVYVCPEPTCVHHDPSRALGDLTGIKKHFSRKHGEKKWKCEKCSKRYAVQSDWKAHSKTCGTREYRCDCGTLFSRRDSFITHRAFCDVLSQERAVLPSALDAFKEPLYAPFGPPQENSQFSSFQESISPSGDILRLGGYRGGAQLSHVTSPRMSSSTAPEFLHSKPVRGLLQLPELNSNATASLFHLGFLSNTGNSNGGNEGTHLPISEEFRNSNGSFFSGNLVDSSFPSEGVLPQMSATALLQRASEMGATAEGNWSSMIHKPFTFSGGGESSWGKKESDTRLQDFVNSLASDDDVIFGAGGTGLGSRISNAESKAHRDLSYWNAGVSDMLTRDFLGVSDGSMVRRIGNGIISRAQQDRDEDISLLQSRMNSSSTCRSFTDGNIQ